MFMKVFYFINEDDLDNIPEDADFIPFDANFFEWQVEPVEKSKIEPSEKLPEEQISSI